MRSSFWTPERKQLFDEIHEECNASYLQSKEQYKAALMELQRQLFHRGDVVQIRDEFERVKKKTQKDD
ncbi:MAG: hypothetical protein HQM13_11250 [SAR324 cluster bacterium]|nr:hypothetical protein [SAR324 cluster bacterium]